MSLKVLNAIGGLGLFMTFVDVQTYLGTAVLLTALFLNIRRIFNKNKDV